MRYALLSIIFLCFMSCFSPAGAENPKEDTKKTTPTSPSISPPPSSSAAPAPADNPPPPTNGNLMPSTVKEKKDDANAIRFYIGASYQLIQRSGSKIVYTDTAQNVNVKFRDMNYFDGFTPHVGLKFGRYIGAEIGCLVTGLSVTTKVDGAAAGESLKLRSLIVGPSLDFMGYYPAVESGALDLVGITGLTFQTVEARVYGSGPANFKKTYQRTSFGVRMGGGFVYHASNNLDVRLLAQYQIGSYRLGGSLPGNFAENGLVVLTFGASYIF